MPEEARVGTLGAEYAVRSCAGPYWDSGADMTCLRSNAAMIGSGKGSSVPRNGISKSWDLSFSESQKVPGQRMSMRIFSCNLIAVILIGGRVCKSPLGQIVVRSGSRIGTTAILIGIGSGCSSWTIVGYSTLT